MLHAVEFRKQHAPLVGVADCLLRDREPNPIGLGIRLEERLGLGFGGGVGG